MFRKGSSSKFSLSDYIIDAPSTPLTPWFKLHKLLCDIHGLRSPFSYLVTFAFGCIIFFLLALIPEPFGSLFVVGLIVSIGLGAIMTIKDLFR